MVGFINIKAIRLEKHRKKAEAVNVKKISNKRDTKLSDLRSGPSNMLKQYLRSIFYEGLAVICGFGIANRQSECKSVAWRSE